MKKLLFATVLLIATCFVSPIEADCMDVIVYATDPSTGYCSAMYLCEVPAGWSYSLDGCSS